MNEDEDDRTGVTPPGDPDEYPPQLQDLMIDVFAENLDLTVEDVQFSLIDGLKFWEIAQEQLPSLEDVEDACTGIMNEILVRTVQEKWIEPSQATGLKKMLYCELFPAFEMGDSMCRETRMPVQESVS